MTLKPAEYLALQKLIKKYNHLSTQSPNIAALLDITRADRELIEKFLNVNGGK